MKNLFWFVFGIASGFVLAHLMNKDPRGHELLAEADSRITEFTDRMGDAYREQEAKIGGVLDEAKNAAVDAVATAPSSASDAGASAQKLSD